MTRPVRRRRIAEMEGHNPMKRSLLIQRRGVLALAAGAVGLSALRPAVAQPALGVTRPVGAGLYEVVVSISTGTVYVAAVGVRGGQDAPKPQIVALDGTTLATKSAIELEFPAFGLGLNDRTQRLFTTNTIAGSVSIIDLGTGRAIGHAQAGEKAHLRQVVVDEAKNLAYATAFGGGRTPTPSAIWVVDGATGKVDHVVSEGLEEGGITGIALDAARNRLFATALMSNEIVEVDLAARKALRRFPSGGDGAVNVALDAAGRRLFVTHQKTGGLVVLNADSGAVIGTVATGAGALGVSFDATRNRIVVANRQAGTTSVVDGANLTVLASLETGTHPNTVAINGKAGLAYVTNKKKAVRRGEPPVEDPRGDTVSLIRL